MSFSTLVKDCEAERWLDQTIVVFNPDVLTLQAKLFWIWEVIQKSGEN